MKLRKATLLHAQVKLNPSLFQKNALSSLHVTDFDVESFIDFLKSNLVTEKLRSLYCKLGNELDERTSSISEMIPDDVWMSVFQCLPKNKTISYYYSLKGVCKRWTNMYSNTAANASPIILPSIRSLQVSSFGAIRKLDIDKPFRLSIEFFQAIFPPLKTLIISSPDVKRSSKVTSDLWRQLTNLRHLEICDLPDPPFTCDCQDYHCFCRSRAQEKKYYNFIIDSDALSQLTSLETLILGQDQESLDLSCTNLSLLTNLSKLRVIYDCCGNGECEEIFERDEKDKLERRGKLSWPNGYCYEEGNYENLLDRDRYEGDIDYFRGDYKYSNFMHGEGVLFYKEGNKYNALRFEGVFEENKEKEGVIYFSNGDRYEGKFSYEGFGKIIFQNGDLYSGETKDFKMHERNLVS